MTLSKNYDSNENPLEENMVENTGNQTIETPVVPENKKPQESGSPASLRDKAVKAKSMVDDRDPSRKVSLVELIMILMLVGLVLVFIFGMQQMKIDKEKELIAQHKVEEVIPIFEQILKSIDNYRKQDAFGDYPMSLDELGTFESESFTFDYSYEEMIVKGITTEAFGKKGIEIIYSITNQVYEVDDPNTKEKPTIKDEWLP
ncbi:MAG: hypothetical protein WCY64_07455 [Candidatus Cloacimonadaceae bacterium]